MEVTYAIVVKKVYQNIVTTLDENIYDVINIFDSYELADSASKNAEGDLLSNLNKIDTNGFLKTYQIKVLPLEGKYDINQVKALVNILKDKIFTKNKKVL